LAEVITVTQHPIAATLNLLRLHTAGFEGFVFTAGPLLNGSPGTLGDYAILWLLGILVTGYIFALNDVIDLPHDRMNPARTGSPLVTGAISERAALLWSVTLPLIAVAIVAVQEWPVPALVSFSLLLALGGAVNLYQKVTAHPLVMDVLFAVTMAVPLPIAARAMSDSVGPAVWSATALLFFLALQLNSIAGNLKDLESDRRTGFRTVAIAFGAVLAEGRLVPGRAYSRYCWAISATIVITGAISLYVILRHAPPVTWIVCAITMISVMAWGMHSLHRLLSGVRPPSPRGREPYFAAGFLIFLVAVLATAHWTILIPALAALAIWEVGFRLFWSWYRRAEFRALYAEGVG
jgi:4-hydroxybenzoate polyprenyltransferase